MGSDDIKTCSGTLTIDDQLNPITDPPIQITNILDYLKKNEGP